MPKIFPAYEVFKRLDDSESYYVLESFMSIDGVRTRVSRGGFKSEAEARNWIESHKPKVQPDRTEILRQVVWLIDTLDDGESPVYRLVQESINDVIAGRIPLPERRQSGQ